MSSGGNVAAYIDRAVPVELNGKSYDATVRSMKCQFLTSSSKCSSCVAYCDALRSMYHRWLKSINKASGSTKSHVNDKWLRTPEKKEKLENLKKRIKSADKTIRYSNLSIGSYLASSYCNLQKKGT